MWSRAVRAQVTALIVITAFAALASACGEASESRRLQLWVADNYVQCNDFEEPFRECLLVSQLEFGLYRHLEGSIEGFDYEEGTSYLLEVERTDDALTSGAATYRLLEVLSTE